MVKSLRERWIDAMCKVPLSLIGYNGYTEEQARFVCQCFRQSAPKRPDLVKVLALESETGGLPAGFPDRKVQEENLTPPARAKVEPKEAVKITAAVGQIEDYPEPWCKVSKDGKVIRYEDANGRPIPEVIVGEHSVY